MAVLSPVAKPRVIADGSFPSVVLAVSAELRESAVDFRVNEFTGISSGEPEFLEDARLLGEGLSANENTFERLFGPGNFAN